MENNEDESYAKTTTSASSSAPSAKTTPDDVKRASSVPCLILILPSVISLATPISTTGFGYVSEIRS